MRKFAGSLQLNSSHFNIQSCLVPVSLHVASSTSQPSHVPPAVRRYLMQIFSEPLFKEDTFFMEVLERRGARGFGQGNITALARSIIEDQRRQQESGLGEEAVTADSEGRGRRSQAG